MTHTGLEKIVAQLSAVDTDLTAIMRLIGSYSADWIEMRHTPPNPELDGFRSRDDFVEYLMREAAFFPGTFNSIRVKASARVVEGYIAIEPLSFAGTLAGQDRQVDIRYILTLHFDGEALCKITGALTRENIREDVIAWLKVIEGLGGLGQTLALEQPGA